MRSVRLISAVVFLLTYTTFSYASGTNLYPRLKITQHTPLVISILEADRSYSIALPSGFFEDIDGAYDDVYISNLDEDGTGEVVFHLAGSDVNSCSRVLHYSKDKRALVELDFGGQGLCNFKIRQGYIVSSYREGAVWNEDVFRIEEGQVVLVLSDNCVGCGEIKRKKYGLDGSFVRFLVSDNTDFEKRTPMIAKVASITVEIFFSPDKTRSTAKYLVQGDEIIFIGFDQSEDGEEWIEFRFSESSSSIEGWLRCRDLEGCMSN